MNSMLLSISNYLSGTIEPIIEHAIISTYKFFALIGVDPDKASKYGAEAVATIFATYLVIRYLYKFIKATDQLFSSISELFSFIKRLVIQFGQGAMQSFVKVNVASFFSADTYKKIIAWVSMSESIGADQSVKESVLYQKSQNNIGIAIVALSTWSGLAFVYAVVSASSGFLVQSNAIIPAAVAGGLLYSTMIMVLDRSMTIPRSIPSAEDVSNELGGERKILLSAAMLACGLGARVFISFMIAKFTALPITIMILYGGIVQSHEDVAEKERTRIIEEIAGARKNFEDLAYEKLQSKECKDATAAVARSEDGVDGAARSGCRKGVLVCPDKWTEAARAHLNETVLIRNAICNVQQSDIDAINGRIAILDARLKEVKPIKSVDVLSGAVKLEELAKDHEDNRYFNPVTSTYYLILVIELIPFIMKIWQEIRFWRLFSPASARGRLGGASVG